MMGQEEKISTIDIETLNIIVSTEIGGDNCVVSKLVACLHVWDTYGVPLDERGHRFTLLRS